MRLRLVPQVCLLGLFLLGSLLAFSGNLNSYFLSDDFVQIGKVLHKDFSVAWGYAHGGFFRPLFILSYIIDSRIWHDRSFGYHLTNVVIHAVNSFLVFNVSLALLRPLQQPANAIKAAAAAGALFLLHPSHTEAVTWISGRADLIATLFSLAALCCFCRYAGEGKRTALILALVFGALALLGKESAVCLPFLILVAGIYLARPTTALATFGGFMAALLAFVLVRAKFLGAIVGGYGTNQHLNFAPGWIRDRLLEADARSVLPAFPATWSWFLFKPLQSPLFIVIALACFGLLAAAIAVRRRFYERLERKRQNRLLLVIVGLFLISLLPVISLRLSLYESQGERFLYLPTVFSCLLVGYLSTIMIRNRTTWLVVLVCALGFYAWRLYAANQLWREAAQLTRSIKDDLTVSASQSRLTVLNVPDNLRGVPVFHNGLPEALQFFQAQKLIKTVDIGSFQTLQSARDETEVRLTGETLLLQTFNRGDVFDRATGGSCLELSAQSPTRLEFKPLPCLNQTSVHFFSGGNMRRFDPLPPLPRVRFSATSSRRNFSSNLFTACSSDRAFRSIRCTASLCIGVSGVF